jgi:hypothetical protein
MGAAVSSTSLSTSLIDSITDQFNKLTTHHIVMHGIDTPYLRFNEIIRFQCPPAIPVNLSHLVTLYALYSMENQLYNQSQPVSFSIPTSSTTIPNLTTSSPHNNNIASNSTATKAPNSYMGITLPQLIAFLSWCCNKCNEFSSNSDRMARLEGLFCVKLWHDLRVYGNEHVLAWFTRLVLSINEQYFKTSHYTQNPPISHLNTPSMTNLPLNSLHSSILASAQSASHTLSATVSTNLPSSTLPSDSPHILKSSNQTLPQSPSLPCTRSSNSISAPLSSRRSVSTPIPPVYPRLPYVHHDALEPLFIILQPYLSSDSSLSAFMNQLQMTSEQHALLDIEDETLDDYVPLPVLSLFLSYVVEGMRSMFSSIAIAPRSKAPI